MDLTAGKLFLALGFKFDESSAKKVQSEAEALNSTLKKILGVVGITLTVSGIKNFIQETSAAAADFKATANQFKQTFGEMESVAAESLSNVAKNTGISENRMKQSFTRMAAFAMTTGMETSQATDFTSRAMEALADNAAYFDKSIEYTQETFQKLLKGNFQLDDNLGFNLAEAERNRMALEMFGEKSYNNLEDWQKQELILQKLIEANNAIGATGQAYKEAGEYTNQVGELSDAFLQLRVNIGQIFLDPLLTVQTKLAEVMHKIAAVIGDVNDKSSVAYRISTKVNQLVDKGVRLFDKWVGIARTVVDRLGGVSNALEILGMGLKVVVGIVAAGRIVSILTSVNWKLLGIVAAAMLLYLIIDDIVGFFKGKNSVFGDVLDALGLDQDTVRENGLNMFHLLQVGFEEVIASFEALGAAVHDFYVEHKEEIDAIAESLGNIKKTSFQKLADTFEVLAESLGHLVNSVKILKGAFKTGDWKGAITDIWSSYADTEAKLKENKTYGKYIGNPLAKKAAEDAKDKDSLANSHLFGEAYRKVSSKLLRMTGLADYYASDEYQDYSDAVNRAIYMDEYSEEDAKNNRENAKKAAEAINTYDGSTVTGTITSILGDKASGKDAGDQYAEGVESSGLHDAIVRIAQRIKDILGHSKPKYGPMSDDDTWMPDMMQNFINGILSKRGEFEAAVQSLANIVNDNLGGIMELGSPGTSIVGRSAGRNTSVVQNISFSNTFNGDTRENQVRAGSAMKSNANDTSSYLANAIAYGR